MTISAGRLVWEKNLEKLIETTELVGDKCGRDYTHLHYGSFGNSKEELESFSHNFKYFRFMSNVSSQELAKLVSLADAFVMASVSEGFGLVYAEAMACGVPVVTSNLAPMNEYIIDGVNGLLVDPKDSGDMANKTLEVLENKKLSSLLGRNARKFAEELFDSEKLSLDERDIYIELLGA